MKPEPATAFLRGIFGVPPRGGDMAEGAVARVELNLRLEDGEPWTVSFSPGIERFIGHYPRLDAIAPEGTLLAFTRIPHAG